MFKSFVEIIRESVNASNPHDEWGINGGATPTSKYEPNEGDSVIIKNGQRAGQLGHIYHKTEDGTHKLMDTNGYHIGNYKSSDLGPDDHDIAPGGYTSTEQGAAGAFNESAQIIPFPSTKMPSDTNIKQAVKGYYLKSMERGAQYHQNGKLPLPIGTRLFHPVLPPSEVVGHYVHPIDPDRYGYDVEDSLGRGSQLLVNEPNFKDWKPATKPSLVKEDGEGAMGGSTTNTAGGGGIAGIGVSSPNPSLTNQAEPGVNRKRKKSILLISQLLARKQPVNVGIQ